MLGLRLGHGEVDLVDLGCLLQAWLLSPAEGARG